MRWSETVFDYQPVNPKPRWGFGKPVHAAIQSKLDRSRAGYESVLKMIASHRAALHAIPHADNAATMEPYWDNAWFSCLDAASQVSFLLERQPRRYIEIGSGLSTRFARWAVRRDNLGTTIVSIDPHPHTDIDSLCDHVIRRPLEECDLGLFGELNSGDILFFDGSHRIFTNSDVTTFFFDILPNLPPGVLVHLHDVFLPADYPQEWNERLYSEQYLLGAMLLAPELPFRIVLPNYFVGTDASLGEKVKAIFRSENGRDIPFIYDNDARIPGVSFWFETL